MSGNVFINYRRDDSSGWAGRLHDRLVRTLPARRVFIDVDDIPPGEDFASLLDAQVAQCDVFLAVIGPRWLHSPDAGGHRRIDNPSDFVRIEIASALRRNSVHVIPVLVDGASVPSAGDLPEDIRPLVERNALPIRGEYFHRDSDRLVATVCKRLPLRVRRHRLLRALSAAAAVMLAAAVPVAALYSGRLPSAFGLEALIRPSAREWRMLTYVDKTNPALLTDFVRRHPDSPEGREARLWMQYLSSRAWSKVKDSDDRRELADFLATFRDSDEAKAAAQRLAELPPPAGSPAGGQPLARFADCPDCPEMIMIPAGSLLMGSLDSEWTTAQDRHEGPRQTVRIAAAFAVGRFEVTVGQYRQFVAATGHQTGNECIGIIDPASPAKVWDDIPGRDFLSPGFAQADDHPVVCVSWHDAMAYLRWLSERTGADYRLPTEAEWEYVARAGKQDAYAFGDDESRLCQYGNGADRGMDATWDANRWCADGVRVGTARVGAYRPNAFGLMDTHGNVHEWVADCYHDAYTDMPASTRASGAAWAAPDCATRVIRGGCWAYPPAQLRSARREAWEPFKRSYCVGFRVARTLTP